LLLFNKAAALRGVTLRVFLKALPTFLPNPRTFSVILLKKSPSLFLRGFFVAFLVGTLVGFAEAAAFATETELST